MAEVVKGVRVAASEVVAMLEPVPAVKQVMPLTASRRATLLCVRKKIHRLDGGSCSADVYL